MVHGAVDTRTNLSDGSVKANPVLDDVMNPVVRNFSTWCFALHDLNDSPIRLQVTDIPDFVVEDRRRITDGKHR